MTAQKLFLITTLLLALTSQAIRAQIVDGRTNDVTFFHDYQPATILLASGKLNRQAAANIFLKNGALIYKSQGKVMQANMDVVSRVMFGERQFMKVDNKLAEVVDSCGENLLVMVSLINMEGLNTEILNNSTITNISTGANHIGVTRVDASPESLNYPVDEIYYFVVNDKIVLAHERDARRAAGRKKLRAYETLTSPYSFRWTDRNCLMEILKLLSEE